MVKVNAIEALWEVDSTPSKSVARLSIMKVDSENCESSLLDVYWLFGRFSIEVMYSRVVSRWLRKTFFVSMRYGDEDS